MARTREVNDVNYQKHYQLIQAGKANEGIVLFHACHFEIEE